MLDNLLAAAAQFQPMTEIPFLNSKLTGEAGDASAVFNALFKLAITIGAMLAVFMFIWGGLQMITARDSAGSVGAGKTKMTNAIMGLLMLISTFVVLNTINPQLTSLALFKGANGEDISRLEAAPRGSQPITSKGALKNEYSGNTRKFCEDYFKSGEEEKDAENICLIYKDSSGNNELSNIKQNLKSTLLGTEKRYCPRGVLEDGCYKSHHLCGKGCTERDIVRTAMAKDGSITLYQGNIPLGKYTSNDACELASLNKRLSAGGSGLRCGPSTRLNIPRSRINH